MYEPKDPHWEEPDFEIENLPDECQYTCSCKDCGDNPKGCAVCKDCVDGSECADMCHCFVQKGASEVGKVS